MTGRELERCGYTVQVASDGNDALTKGLVGDYDVIILDVSSDVLGGVSICKRLREKGCWSSILLLSQTANTEDRVKGLDSGADDYVPKPLPPRELEARVRALTRRKPHQRPIALTVGDLTLDPATREVMRGQRRVELTPREFSLLHLFMLYPGVALTRRHIRYAVWDLPYDRSSNVVDVYVRYLRDKIDRPFARASIESVRGIGYRLRADGDQHVAGWGDSLHAGSRSHT